MRAATRVGHATGSSWLLRQELMMRCRCDVAWHGEAKAVSVFDQRKKRDGFQKRTIKENTVEEGAAVAS